MPNYPINKLIADFDETVSEVDTIRLIANAAADNRATLSEREQFLADWQEMVEWYATRYGRILDEWLAKIDNHQLSIVNCQLSTLTDFLKSFEALEQASLRRVMDKKFLAGLTKDQLKETGQKVVKLPGVERVLSAMCASGVGIEILSANWSHTLIEGAMEGLCNQIVTNDLVFDSVGHSTGQILMRVVSAQDKLQYFKERRATPPVHGGDQGSIHQAPPWTGGGRSTLAIQSPIFWHS